MRLQMRPLISSVRTAVIPKDSGTTARYHDGATRKRGLGTQLGTMGNW